MPFSFSFFIVSSKKTSFLPVHLSNDYAFAVLNISVQEKILHLLSLCNCRYNHDDLLLLILLDLNTAISCLLLPAYYYRHWNDSKWQLLPVYGVLSAVVSFLSNSQVGHTLRRTWFELSTWSVYSIVVFGFRLNGWIKWSLTK